METCDELPPELRRTGRFRRATRRARAAPPRTRAADRGRPTARALARARNSPLPPRPPPKLSPELENVPWPDDALGPVFGRRKHRVRRPVLLAAALATAVVAGFV